MDGNGHIAGNVDLTDLVTKHGAYADIEARRNAAFLEIVDGYGRWRDKVERLAHEAGVAPETVSRAFDAAATLARHNKPDGAVVERFRQMLDQDGRDQFGFLSPSPIGKNLKTETGWRFESISDLLTAPEEDVDFLVDGLLPTAGFSLLVGAPKAGKSTLGRCLAFAVSHGFDWLGRETVKGSVLGVFLEEKRAEVARHFKQLGVREDDDVRLAFQRPPKDAVSLLADEVNRIKPSMLVIDPLFRFIQVADGNDYAQVTNALEPLLRLARDTGTHVLAIHHARKSGGSLGEETLGSSAIFGAVDTALFVKRDESRRSVYSVNRYGRDMEESVLAMDEHGWVSVAGSRAYLDRNAAGREIVTYLEGRTEPVQQKDILDNITGTKKTLIAALKGLVEEKKIRRTGVGRKGSPFLFFPFRGEE